MKKKYTNQANKAHSSLYSESGPKSKKAPNFNGGENVSSAKLKQSSVQPLTANPVDKKKLSENLAATDKRINAEGMAKYEEAKAKDIKRNKRNLKLMGIAAAGTVGGAIISEIIQRARIDKQ